MSPPSALVNPRDLDESSEVGITDNLPDEVLANPADRADSPALADPIDLDAVQCMRISQVLRALKVSASFWFAGVRAGRFPRPIKLGPQTSIYRRRDICALLDHMQTGAEPLARPRGRRSKKAVATLTIAVALLVASSASAQTLSATIPNHGPASEIMSVAQEVNQIMTVRQSADATSVEGLRVVAVPVDQLILNDYNPNRMTADQFAELVAEVRHLKRLPKPVVVRPQGDHFLIVDGEHGWRAAREVGLAEVPCEVIEADDFEAMRQTYKRNRHGDDHPPQLGRMFHRMMQAQDLSQRGLATELGVSEGTVRTALLYTEAAQLRSSYAETAASDDGVPRELRVPRGKAPGKQEAPEDTIARLSGRQVRAYTQLPPQIGNLWLDTGANLRALYGANSADEVEKIDARHPQRVSSRFRRYFELEQTGLLEYLGPRVSRQGFAAAMKELEGWATWERQYLVGGLEIATLRPYSRHYFEHARPVRTGVLMGFALELLIDPTTQPASFRLTEDEFAQVVAESVKRGDADYTFQERLRFQIHSKHGRLPEDRGSVRWQLQRAEIIEAAPAYIRVSRLPVPQQYALWKTMLGQSPVHTFLDGEDEDTCLGRVEVAKQALAGLEELPRREGERLDEEIRRLLVEHVQTQRHQEALQMCTEHELARAVAERVPFYDRTKDGDAIDRLTGVFAQLTRAELLFFEECAKPVRGKQYL